jgi:hypothetical protein
MAGNQGIGMNSFEAVGCLRRTFIGPSDDKLGFGR